MQVACDCPTSSRTGWAEAGPADGARPANGESAYLAYTVGIAVVNSGAPVLASTLVATTATPATEAAEGYLVLVVVVVEVWTPTITSAVNGHPRTSSCSIRRDRILRNSKSSDDGLSSQRASIPGNVELRHLNIDRQMGQQSIQKSYNLLWCYLPQQIRPWTQSGI